LAGAHLPLFADGAFHSVQSDEFIDPALLLRTPWGRNNLDWNFEVFCDGARFKPEALDAIMAANYRLITIIRDPIARIASVWRSRYAKLSDFSEFIRARCTVIYQKLLINMMVNRNVP
jgi:hypothetical protein